MAELSFHDLISCTLPDHLKKRKSLTVTFYLSVCTNTYIMVQTLGDISLAQEDIGVRV